MSNGGFETGQAPWAETSKIGAQLITTNTPHTGSYAAWLCGYNSCNDSIGQTIIVPSSYTSLTLTFWLDQTHPDSSCSGLLKAQLKTSGGAVIATPFNHCSSIATNGYVQQTVTVTNQLLAYKGQQVQVVFAGTGSATGSVNYFLDDVSLAASGATGATNSPSTTSW